MRYDNLLRAIDKASAKYEAEIRSILQRFSKSDEDTAAKILKGTKRYQDIDSFVRSGYSRKPKRKSPRKSKKPHWTQRPENKERLRKMLSKSAKARAENGSAS